MTDLEPLSAAHPLWSLPNCILTPHVAGLSFSHLPQTGEHLAHLRGESGALCRRRSAAEPRAGDPAVTGRFAPPARPGACIWAIFIPRCSRGFPSGRRAGVCCCASRTLTHSAVVRPMPSSCGGTSAGSGSDWDGEMPPQSTKPGLCRTFCKTGGAGPDLPVLLLRSELHDASAPCLGRHGALFRRLPRPDTGAARRNPRPVASCAGSPSHSGTVSAARNRTARRDLRRFYRPTLRRRVCYQLAVVCDDALGSVTEVVRGSDLLGSTARQLWLFSVFGYPAPQYYHVPLLVAPDGRRLSKRERADMERSARAVRRSSSSAGWRSW